MANNRNLKVNLEVTAEIKKAKQEINQLQEVLGRIKTDYPITIKSDALKNVGREAEQVQLALEKAFNVDTGKLDLSRFSQSLKDSKMSLTDLYNDFQRVGKDGTLAIQQLSRQIALAETPVLTLNTKMKEFLGTIANTARWQLSSSFLHGAIGSIQSAINYAKELNDSLTSIQIVTQKSDEEMAKFAESANRAAKELSTTTNRYAQASLIYFQQGLDAEEVEKRAAITVKMANVTGDTAETVSQQLTSVWNNFYDGSKSLESYADGMTALGAATATSSAEIAQGLQKFSSIGQTVGLSYEYAASALATITATTRESADTVGNALKSLFARIEGLNLGETADDGTTLNKYSAALAKVGVNIKDANGSLKDMDQILDELGERWQNISREQQVALAQTVAGQRQYAQLMTLMNNWDFMKENLQTVASSSGTLQKQADIYAKSWEAASTRVRASLEEIYTELVKDDFFIGLSNFATRFINIFADVIKGMGEFKGILLLISSIVLDKYSKEIPNAIQSFTNTISLFTGSAQKEAKALQEENKSYLDTLNTADGLYDFQIQKIKILGTLKSELLSKEKELSDTEKIHYESQISNLSKSLDLLDEEKQAVVELELEKRKALKEVNQSSKGINTGTSFYGDPNTQTPAVPYDMKKIRDEFIQLAQDVGTANGALDNFNTDWNEFNTNDPKFIEKTVDLFKEYEEKGYLAAGAIEKIQQAQNECGDDTWAFIEKIDQMSESLFKVGDGNIESGTERLNEILEILDHTTGENAEKAKRLAASLREYQEAADKSGRRTEDFNHTLEATTGRMETNVEHSKNLAESWSQAFSKTSAIAMGLTSLGSLIDRVSNPDTSGIDKLISSLSSLPMIMNSIAAVKDLGTTISGIFGIGSGIATGITGGITAVLALITVVEKLKKAHQEALDAAAQHAKEVSDEWSNTVKTKEEEYQANRDLITQYKELLKNYKETGEGKADLLTVGEQIADAYDSEGSKLDLLSGKYSTFLNTILDVNAARQDQLILEQKAALNATETAIDKEIASNSAFKTSKNIAGNEESPFAFLFGENPLMDPKHAIEGILAGGEGEISQFNFDHGTNLTLENQKTLREIAEDVLGLSDEERELFEQDVHKFSDSIERNADSIVRALGDNVGEIQTTVLELSTGQLANDQQLLNQLLEQLAANLEEDAYDFDEDLQKITFNFDSDNFEESLYNTIQKIQTITTTLGANEDFSQSPFYETLSSLFPQELIDLATQWNEQFSNIQMGKVVSKAQEILRERKEGIASFKDYQDFMDQLIAELSEDDTLKGRTDLKSLIDQALEGTDLVDEAYTGNYKILTQLAEKTGIEAQKLEEEVYDNLSDTAKENFGSLDLEVAANIIFKSKNKAIPDRIKDFLNEQAEIIKEEAENDIKSGSIASSLEALENIDLSKTLSFKNLKKLKDSGIDWGNEELGIIPWEEFEVMDSKGQMEYLRFIKASLTEADTEIQKETLRIQNSNKEIYESFNNYLDGIIKKGNLDDETKEYLTSLQLNVQETIATYNDSIKALEAEINADTVALENSQKSLILAISLKDLKVGKVFSADEVEAFEKLGINIDKYVDYLDDGTARVKTSGDELVKTIIDQKVQLYKEQGTAPVPTEVDSLQEANALLENDLFNPGQYAAAVRYLDAMGQLELTFEDLGKNSLENILGTEKYEEYAGKIDLTNITLEELKEKIAAGAIPAEALSKKIDELLSKDDLSTKEAIELCNQALADGTYNAEQYISATKDLLTEQEQFRNIMAAPITEQNADETFEALSSFMSSGNLSLEDSYASLNKMVEAINEMGEAGSLTSPKMEELYNQALKVVQMDDQDFTLNQNLEQLQYMLANGLIGMDQYREGIQQLVESYGEWGMTAEEVYGRLVDIQVKLYQQNGTLEDNAGNLGRQCASMENYQTLMKSLINNQASEEAQIKASNAALGKLGSQYDSCKDALKKLTVAMESHNKELQKAVESELKLSVRAEEAASTYNLEAKQIKTLAKSYQELAKQGGSAYQAAADNEEIAVDLATRYINLNKGVKNLQENWEDYEETLNELVASKDSVEAMNSVFFDHQDALNGIQTAMAQVLNISDPTSISFQFLADNADLVRQAMEGDSAAVAELQARMAEDFIMNLEINDEDFYNALNMTKSEYLNWINTLPPGELDADDTLFLEKLANLMLQAGYTVDQIEDYFAGCGIDVDFEELYDEFETVEDEAVKSTNVVADAYNALSQFLPEKVKQMTDKVAEAMGIDTEMTSQTATQEDNSTFYGIQASTEPVPYHVEVPRYHFSASQDGVSYTADVAKLDMNYSNITATPVPVPVKETQQKTASALRVKTANKTYGGNISHTNSTGGNKRTTTPSSTPRSSARTSTPRESTPAHVSPPTVKVHDTKFNERKTIDDYQQDKVRKETPNKKENPEEVHTSKKKYYNERYEKDATFEEKEYEAKDSSIYKQFDDEIEKYHDVSNALENISHKLDEIDQRKSRAFGKAHLDALNDEKNALQDQLKLQEQYIDEMGQRSGELRQRLEQKGYTFDENGSISNYVDRTEQNVIEHNLGMERTVEQHNKNVDEWNKAYSEAYAARNEAYRKAKDKYNAAMQKETERYNTAVGKADDIRNASDRAAIEKYNKGLEELAVNPKFNADNAANNEYLATMRKAVNTYNKAVAEAETTRENALSQAESNRMRDLTDAYNRYLEGGNKDAYDDIVSTIENAYSNAVSIAENVYSNSMDKASDVFDKTKTKADNKLKEAKDDSSEAFDAAVSDLASTLSAELSESKNIHTKSIDVAQEIYDDNTHQISEDLQNAEDLADKTLEVATDAADKTFDHAEKMVNVAKEGVENTYTTAEEMRQEYETLEDEIQNAMLSAQELRNKIYDNALEVIDYTLNLKVRISNEVMTALEAYLSALGDKADKAADRITNLASQMGQFAYQVEETRTAIADLLNSTGNIDQSIINRLMSGSEASVDDLNAIIAGDLFTEGKIAQLEEYRDSLVSLINEQRNLKEQMFSNIESAFNEYQDSLDRQVQKIVSLTKVTETYKNIIGIIGKKTLDATGQVSELLARQAFESQRRQTETYKTILDEIDSNLADMKYKQSQYDLDSEMYKDFQEKIDAMEDKRRSAQENWLSSWEAEMQSASDYYANAIDTITMAFETSVAGIIGSLDQLQSEMDRQKQIADVYVEDYEKIYQLNKLNRDIEEAINDSDRVKNKQQLKKLQDEINKASADGVKMSQYDLDVLRKKFELEIARSELEEARNAKSQVRMMRDAEGNYGYVYTADANAVADAEQSYEDKLHELQVLNTEYIKQLEDNYLQLQQNVRDQIANLDITQFATEEEYLAEVDRIQSAALELQKRYGQQMDNAINNNRDLYENDWATYSRLTGYKISLDEEYLDKFTETQYSVLTGYKSMEEASAAFAKSLEDAVASVTLAYEETRVMQQTAMNDGATSMEEFAKSATNATNEVGKQTQALAKEAKDLSISYRDAFTEIANKAKDFADNYTKNIQPAIDKSLELLDVISQIIESQAGLNTETSSSSGGETSGTTSSSSSWTAFQTIGDTIGATSEGFQKYSEYLPYIAALLRFDEDTNFGGWGDVNSRAARLEKVFGEGAADDINRYLAKYGDELATYRSIMNEKGTAERYSYERLKKIIKLDTGGYTGEWASNLGKLAFLHEKELVLNKEDTANLLTAVDMIRNIAQVIDLNARSTSQAMSSAFSAGLVQETNRNFEQDVHITAEFPNATDRDEIIAAFDNLTNLAYQLAGQQ